MTHLKMTANEPKLQSIKAALAAGRAGTPASKWSPIKLPAWLSLSEEEFARLWPSTLPLDPIDPLLHDEVAAHALENGEKPDRAKGSKDDGEEQGIRAFKAAFKAYVASADLGSAASDREALLGAAAFLLREVFQATNRDLSCAEIGAAMVAEQAGGGLSTADPRLLGACIGDLRQAFMESEQFDGEELFLGALACLEELRLLVPFPCGGDFLEVPAASAASSCLRWQRSGAGAAEASASRCLFGRVGAGRHWRCDPAPKPAQETMLRSAAALVLHAAGAPTGSLALKKLVLPCRLVAPAAWVSGRGQLNVSVTRFMALSLVRLLARTPGATAGELAYQTTPLEACEVALLLESLVESGMVAAGSLRPAGPVGPQRHVNGVVSNNKHMMILVSEG